MHLFLQILDFCGKFLRNKAATFWGKWNYKIFVIFEKMQNIAMKFLRRKNRKKSLPFQRQGEWYVKSHKERKFCDSATISEIGI